MRYRLGLKNVQPTPRGADGGIDVTATGVVAQVKYQSSRVGRSEIQRIKGAAAGNRAVFFACGSSPFSQPAIEWAREHGVALFTSMVAESHAHSIVQRRRCSSKPRRRTRERTRSVRSESHSLAMPVLADAGC